MPYKRIGTKVYHKKGGKWELKQSCKSAKNAKKAMKLLHGIHSGNWKPTKKRK